MAALTAKQGGPDDNSAQAGHIVVQPLALRGRDGGAELAVRHETIVRRLTPIECERLQGYDDNWTEGQADSARYRQLGNSVAVPCVEWIARRLVGHEGATS